MTSLPTDNPRTLIDELLAEQQRLTAVERFSRAHEGDSVSTNARFYRDLIPLTQPRPGQQYAFEVDLDKCSGCKACVAACHSLNGLDEEEFWRDTGLLFSEDWRQPFQQTVTTACHHCVDPGCLNGCPVLAYEKDPVTGIVRHLDDQCIGCQYCVMKCPYEAPKYSSKRGIVRKCDMCASRLAVGEAPACAQACPSKAIRITFVETQEIKTKYSARTGSENGFLPASPDPSVTLPTTRYRSNEPLPKNLLAGDQAKLKSSPSHLPLVFMLVLNQFAVGANVSAIFFEPAKALMMIAAIVAALAIGLASLHLGKPLKAWRSFLGWRKSWFSREVILFSMYVPIVVAAILASENARLFVPLKIAAAVIGILGVACSAMVYADTRREFWRASQCFGKFFGTTFLLGALLAIVIEGFAEPEMNNIAAIFAVLLVITIVKFGFEQRIGRHLVDENTTTLTPLNKTARLLSSKLGLVSRLRVLCGIFGSLGLPLAFVTNLSGGANYPLMTLAALILSFAGELLERYLFFTAVVPEKMPGSVIA